LPQRHSLPRKNSKRFAVCHQLCDIKAGKTKEEVKEEKKKEKKASDRFERPLVWPENISLEYWS